MNSKKLHLFGFKVSVQITGSREHDFTNVHHGYLTSKRVVPTTWEVESVGTTPGFCSVNYKNGTQLLGDDDMFAVSYTQSTSAEHQNEMFELVSRYVTSIAPNVFDAAGMELFLRVPQEKPTTWINERFFRADTFLSNWIQPRTSPVIQFKIDGLNVALNLFDRNIFSSNEEPNTAIYIACIIANHSFSSDDEILDWLSRWATHQETVLQDIVSLLEMTTDDSDSQ